MCFSKREGLGNEPGLENVSQKLKDQGLKK
jgi:hypothetical protein